MANADNTDMIAYWAGNTGATWTAYQDTLDRMLSPFEGDIVSALRPRPGEHLLDIGCGCGATSLALAPLVRPGGRITGVDVSPPMLARARERAAAASAAGAAGAAGADIAFLEADASVHPFGAAEFDALVSRFGVMFFSRPALAFRHLKRALKPRGRMVFACWRRLSENPWAAEPLALAARHMPMPAPPLGYAPGPFAFAEPDFLKSVLREAGFADIALAPIDRDLFLPESEDEAIAFFLKIGPLARAAAEAPNDMRQRLKDDLAHYVRSMSDWGGRRNKGAIWLVSANA